VVGRGVGVLVAVIGVWVVQAATMTRKITKAGNSRYLMKNRSGCNLKDVSAHRKHPQRCAIAAILILNSY